MAQGITIDISARVTGYEASLRTLQNAIQKLDPGSEMGKSITRAFSQASDQVKNLSKNMFPKATNDTQIDNIIEKADRAGEAIQRVAQMMQSITIKDLNLGSLGGDIEKFKNEIATLQNELETRLSVGLVKAISDSTELSNMFKQLGTDLSSANSTTLLNDISNGAKQAAQDVHTAEQELEKVQNELANRKALDTSLSGMKLSTLEGRTALDDELKQISNKYDNFIADLRSKMQEGLSSLTLPAKGEHSAKNLLDSFFSDLTPDNIKNHISSLFDSLVSEKAFGNDQKRKFYEAIFGNEYNTTNVNTLVNSFGFKEIFAQYKIEIQEFFNNIANDISAKDQAKISRLINIDNLDAAVNETTRALDNAYSQLYKTIKENKERINELLNDEQGAAVKLQLAKDTATMMNNADTSLRQEINNLREQNAELIKRVTALETERDEKLRSMIGGIHSAGGQVNTDIGKEFIIGTDAARQYKAELAQVQAKEQALGKIQGVVQRWFSIYAAIRMVGNAIREVISTIQKLDATITEIAIVTNMSQSQLWDQMPKYTQLARDYAASISGVYQVSQLYYQQGLQTSDVMALTEQTLKMARISGLDYATATDYMTNAIRSFKMEMTDAQRVVDVYSAIAASSATNVTELASAMSKTASSAEAVGSSFENTTAMMAVMIEATRESAENIGSALKSIISRYGEMKADPSKLVDSEGEAMSLNKVDTALQTVGISIHNAAGEFRDFDDVIMELAEKWNTIDKNTQRYIATIMAGNRQQSRFLALVSSYDRLKELSAEAASSEDAAQLQFLKTLDSTTAKLQQFETSVQALYVNSGLEDLYKTILDIANRIITSFDQLGDNNGLLSVIGKIGTSFTSVAILITTAFSTLKSHFQSTKNNIVLDNQLAEAQIVQAKLKSTEAQIQADKQLENSAKETSLARIKAAQESNEGTIKSIQDSQKILKEEQANAKKQLRNSKIGMATSAVGMVLSTYAAQLDVEQERQQKAITTGLGGILSGVGTGLMVGGSWGIILGTLTAIPSILESIGMWSETTAEKINRFSKAITNTNNTKLESKDNLRSLTEYKKKFDELQNSQYDSNEAKEEFIKIQNEIAASYPELISSMDAEGNYIVDMTAGYQQLAEAKAQAYKTDYINNLSAELEGLNDLDYVLEKVYGKSPIQEQKNLLFGLLNNNSTANQIHAANLDQLQINENTLQDLFNINNESPGLKKTTWGFNSLVTMVYRLLKPYDIEGDVAEQYKNIIEQARNMIASNKEGISASDVKSHLSTVFPEFSREISYFIDNYFDDLIAAVRAADYQDDLINNKMNAAMQEWINVLGDLTGFKTEGFQREVISSRLNDAWIQFQKDVEEGVGTDAAGVTISKIGSEIKDENGKVRQKTAADLYQEFLNEYDYQWYRMIEEKTRSLQDDTINELYQNRGKYSLTQIKETTAFKNLGDYQQEFLDGYDKAAKNALEQYNGFIGKSFLENDTLWSDLSDLTDLFGFDYLQGITNQIKAVLDNSNLSKRDQTDLITNITSLYTSLGGIDSPELRAAAVSKINAADLTSITGIVHLIDTLSALDIDLDATGITTIITDLKNNIKINLEAEINSYFSSIEEGVDDFLKAVSSGTSGMDFKAATEMAAKLGKSLDSFDIINGKFYYKNIKDLRAAYLKENAQWEQEVFTSLRNEYQKIGEDTGIQGLLGKDILTGNYDLEALQKKLSSTEAQQTFFNTTGMDASTLLAAYEQFKNNVSDNTTTFIDYVISAAQKSISASGQVLNNYLTQNTAITQIKTGDIRGFLETTGYISNVIKTLTDPLINEDEVIAAAEKQATEIERIKKSEYEKAQQDINASSYEEGIHSDLLNAGWIEESDLNTWIEANMQAAQQTLQDYVDNYSADELRNKAVRQYEASGGITLQEIADLTKTINDGGELPPDYASDLQKLYEKYDDNVELANTEFIANLYQSRGQAIDELANSIWETDEQLLSLTEAANYDKDTWSKMIFPSQNIITQEKIEELAQQKAEAAKKANEELSLTLDEQYPTDYTLYLDEAREELRKQQAQQIHDQSEQIINNQIQAIASGDISNLDDDLKQYASVIYDTYHNIQNSISTSMLTALKGGENVIKVTGTNKEFLKTLASQGFVDLSNAYGKVAKKDEEGNILKDEEGNIQYEDYEDLIEGALVTFDVQALQELDAKQWEKYVSSLETIRENKLKLLKDFYDIKYPDTVGNITSMAEKISFTKSELQTFVDNIFGQEGDVDEFIEGAFLTWDDNLGKYIVLEEDYEEYIEYLTSLLEGKTGEEATAAKIKLDSIKREHDTAKITKQKKAFSDAITNYSAVTNDQYTALQESLGEDWEVISQYLTPDGDTYTFDIARLKTDLESGVLKLQDGVEEALSESFAKTIDGYISSIQKATSLVSKGTTNVSEMDSFVQSYNELFKGENKTITDLFSYNTILKAWTLDPTILEKFVRGQAEQLNALGQLADDQVEAFIKEQTVTTLANNVNISNFLKAENREGNSEAFNTLTQAMLQYYKSIGYEATEAAQKVGKSIRELNKGGTAAVEEVKKWAKSQSREATSDELQQAYSYLFDEYSNVVKSLADTTRGSFVTGKLREVLQQLGMVDANGVVNEHFNMAEAYKAIYEQMKNTAGATISGLNDVYAELLTAEDQQNIDTLDILRNADGMTYDAFAKILARYGKSFEQTLKYSFVESTGFGKVRIIDFDRFANYMNFDLNSPEYAEAYNSYIDSMIKLQQQPKTMLQNFANQLKDITKAKPGDLVNVSYIAKQLGWKQLDFNLAEKLRSYGASYADGILKLSDGANIAGLINDIANEAAQAGQLLPEQLAELADAVSDMISSITSLIKSGITGSLTNTKAQSLDAWARQHGFTNGLNFTSTTEGLKLSTVEAIKLYNTIKEIDSLQGQIVFDELNKSLEENNEHYKSITDIMSRIVDLNNKIGDEKVSDARREQYEAELELAKEILAVRSTTEDSSFNFMSNKIPGGQNNPLNYFENWSKAFKAMQDVAKGKGRDKNKIAYEDYYNIITELGNLSAQMGGKGIQLGKDFEVNATNVAQMIEKGAAALSVTADGSIKVDLSKLGIDFAAGSKDLKQNVGKGIQAIAKSQVDMLDSMIALLETIVAMEALGDVDANGDMKITLPEIAIEGETHIGEDGLAYITKFTDEYKIASNKIIETFTNSDNEQLQTALDQVKVNGHTMKEILSASEQDLEDWHISADQMTKIVDGLYQLSLSDNYNVDDVWNSFMQIFSGIDFGDAVISVNATGHEIVLQDGGDYSINWDSVQVKSNLEKAIKNNATEYKTTEELQTVAQEAWEKYKNNETLTIDDNYTLSIVTGEIRVTQDKDNNLIYSVGGKAYPSKEAAAQAAALVRAGANAKDVIEVPEDEGETTTYKSKLKIGSEEIEIISDKDGNITYHAAGGEYTSREEAIKALAAEDLGITYNQVADDQLITYKKKIGVIVDPLITLAEDTSSKITKEVQDKVRAALDSGDGAQLEQINKDYNLGITFNPKVTENLGSLSTDELNSLYSAFGIESKTVSLDATVTASGNANLITLIDEGSIDATIETQVNKDTAEVDLEDLKEKVEVIDELNPTITIDAQNNATSVIDQIQEAINNLHGKTVQIQVEETVSEALGNLGLSKGTIGQAQASGTLMGELGPELVVSQGRYFVVGQGGPEFVNLADDAIVFNHLQTQSLLEKGMSTSRGKAVTNERKAVAFAQGNINGGPAMSSASSALAVLKQLRAQWNAILNMTAQDFAALGGSGGGGGGGGNKAFIKELEKWYNWLQRIATLEKEINYEEARRNRITSEWAPNGEEYYQSQVTSYEALQEQLAVQQDLTQSQEAWFNRRREEMNAANNPFTALYTFDSHGQIQYGEGMYEQLMAISGANDEGKPNRTPEQQYHDILALNPEFANYMQYDSSGNPIEEGDYAAMVQAFWDKIEKDKEEMQSTYDAVEEGYQQLQELAAQQNEILREMRDNQIELEQKVYDAIVEIRQRMIDELTDTKDAIKDSNDKFIKGLSDALTKEQNMYNNAQSQRSLDQLRRRRDILMRSGGSAAEIASLNEQIADQERSVYFDKQQEQIDAIQEASDKQIEKLEAQIQLETELLEYQKKYGLLWAEVTDIMSQSPEQIADFIAQNTESYWNQSPVHSEDSMNQLLFGSQQWAAYRDGGQLQNDIEVMAHALGHESTETTENNNAENTNTETQTPTETSDTSNPSGSGNENSGSSNSQLNNNNDNDEIQPPTYESDLLETDYIDWGPKGHKKRNYYGDHVEVDHTVLPHQYSGDKCKLCGHIKESQPIVNDIDENNNGSVNAGLGSGAQDRSISLIDRISAYQLDIEEMHQLMDNMPNPLINLLSSYNNAYQGLSPATYDSISNTSNSTIRIDKVDVNLNVDELANDYDSRQAANTIMDEMLRIASKTKANNSVRR